MQQYMIEEILEVGKEIYFNKEQEHHIKDVLRMKSGEMVRLVEKNTAEAAFAVIQYYEKSIVARVERLDKDKHELPGEVTICVGILKKEKWEYLLQKVTELGVHRIIPFESNRTVVKMKDSKQEKKIERWRKIVLEAAEQSKRERIPSIEEVQKIGDLIRFKGDLNCVAYEDVALRGVPLSQVVGNQKKITLVLGPEGGFDEKEIEYLVNQGYQCVSLGKRILRAETAAAHGVSIIGTIMEG